MMSAEEANEDNIGMLMMGGYSEGSDKIVQAGGEALS